MQHWDEGILTQKVLDNCSVKAKNTANFPEISVIRSGRARRQPGFMNSIPPSVPDKTNSAKPCTHPRVQIVAREEDTEFLECKECGEVFESSEFRDMNIEDTNPGQEP
jgi:hypothetical protein